MGSNWISKASLKQMVAPFCSWNRPYVNVKMSQIWGDMRYHNRQKWKTYKAKSEPGMLGNALQADPPRPIIKVAPI